jgi:transcriptional regulator with XRE-family HTH domain
MCFHYNVEDLWLELLEELNLPPEIQNRLADFEDVLTDAQRERISEVTENKGSDEVEEELRRMMSNLLSEEASAARSTAASLQKSAEAVRVEGEELHSFVGTNLSVIRRSRGKNQSSFLEEDLEGSVARSTYGNLEGGESTSVRTSTLEDLAEALNMDARVLFGDDALLRGIQMLLVRFDDWRGKGWTGPGRSIRDAIKDALHSDTMGEIERVVDRDGPEASTDIINCLLRLPPLDEVKYDTPGTRFGAVIGWKWGSSLPEEEKDLAAQFIQPIPESDYGFYDFPELGDRVVGAVIMGYWGYYLTAASRDKKDGSDKTVLDKEIWEDEREWMHSNTPEGAGGPGV